MPATCGEQALLALDGEATPVIQDQKGNRKMGTKLLIGLNSNSLFSIK